MSKPDLIILFDGNYLNFETISSLSLLTKTVLLELGQQEHILYVNHSKYQSTKELTELGLTIRSYDSNIINTAFVTGTGLGTNISQLIFNTSINLIFLSPTIFNSRSPQIYKKDAAYFLFLLSHYGLRIFLNKEAKNLMSENFPELSFCFYCPTYETETNIFTPSGNFYMHPAYATAEACQAIIKLENEGFKINVLHEMKIFENPYESPIAGGVFLHLNFTLDDYFFYSLAKMGVNLITVDPVVKYNFPQAILIEDTSLDSIKMALKLSQQKLTLTFPKFDKNFISNLVKEIRSYASSD